MRISGRFNNISSVGASGKIGEMLLTKIAGFVNYLEYNIIYNFPKFTNFIFVFIN